MDGSAINVGRRQVPRNKSARLFVQVDIRHFRIGDQDGARAACHSFRDRFEATLVLMGYLSQINIRANQAVRA
jgi:hypothetical protein